MYIYILLVSKILNCMKLLEGIRGDGHYLSFSLTLPADTSVTENTLILL